MAAAPSPKMARKAKEQTLIVSVKTFRRAPRFVSIGKNSTVLRLPVSAKKYLETKIPNPLFSTGLKPSEIIGKMISNYSSSKGRSFTIKIKVPEAPTKLRAVPGGAGFRVSTPSGRMPVLSRKGPRPLSRTRPRRYFSYKRGTKTRPINISIKVPGAKNPVKRLKTYLPIIVEEEDGVKSSKNLWFEFYIKTDRRLTERKLKSAVSLAKFRKIIDQHMPRGAHVRVDSIYSKFTRAVTRGINQKMGFGK